MNTLYLINKIVTTDYKQYYWSDCTDAVVWELTWIYLFIYFLLYRINDHLHNELNQHAEQYSIFHIITVKLLWNNLYCIKHYKNKGDLTFCFRATFRFLWAGSDLQSLSMCSPTLMSGISPLLMGMGVLHNGHTGTWTSCTRKQTCISHNFYVLSIS